MGKKKGEEKEKSRKKIKTAQESPIESPAESDAEAAELVDDLRIHDDNPLMALDDLEDENSIAVAGLLNAIGLGAAELKKKDGFPFHVDFPSPAVYQTLNGGQRSAFVKTLALAADDTISLLRDALIYESRLLSKKVDVAPQFLLDDEPFLQSLDTDSGLPLSRRFAEMTLWKYVLRVNQKLSGIVARSIAEANKERGVNSEDEDAAAATAADGTNRTFRDYYMSHLTEQYGDELNTIREDSAFKASDLPLLIDSLEAGTAVLTDLQKYLSTRSIAGPAATTVAVPASDRKQPQVVAAGAAAAGASGEDSGATAEDSSAKRAKGKKTPKKSESHTATNVVNGTDNMDGVEAVADAAAGATKAKGKAEKTKTKTKKQSKTRS